MIRLRTPRNFGIRQNKESLRTPNSIIVIACEGKTEEEYFKLFNIKSKIIKVKDISIEVLEKLDLSDTKSAPKHVIDLLEEYRIHYQIDNDELWMVIDRDRQNNSKKQLEEIVESCNNQGFNIALSNPTFELWILLHIKTISEYEDDVLQKIKDNKKVNKNKRFLEKELSNLLGGYTKGVIKKDLILPNVKTAIKQAKQIDKQFKTRKLDNFGTTVFLLAEKIIK
ncbi:MAG: RloB family protein [Flavobacterium sp.]|nr:RloB family protein [Flavobacterium sp.]